MTAALLTGEGVSDELREAVTSGTRTRGVERGVVILGPDGEPLAWAGRHRFVPLRDTAELRAVITPFYVSLEARRQTPGGGSAVGSVLLDAAPAAPRLVLPPDAGWLRRLGRRAHRPRRGAAARGGGRVAPRARAPLVVAGGCRRAGARGALRRPLLRPWHHAARGRRGVRAVDVVGGGGRDGGDGAGARRGGTGARHRRAAAPALDPAGGVRVGRHGRARRLVVVESVRRLARVVHLRVAPRAGGRAGTSAPALGGARDRDGSRDGGGARHVGRGRGGPAGARGARRPRVGRGGRPARRVAVGAAPGPPAPPPPPPRRRGLRPRARPAPPRPPRTPVACPP